MVELTLSPWGGFSEDCFHFTGEVPWIPSNGVIFLGLEVWATLSSKLCHCSLCPFLPKAVFLQSSPILRNTWGQLLKYRFPWRFQFLGLGQARNWLQVSLMIQQKLQVQDKPCTPRGLPGHLHLAPSIFAAAALHSSPLQPRVLGFPASQTVLLSSNHQHH